MVIDAACGECAGGTTSSVGIVVILMKEGVAVSGIVAMDVFPAGVAVMVQLWMVLLEE